MRPAVAATLTLFICTTLISGIVCPFAKCGSLTFLNKFVESPDLRWLFHDLPGHPVPPCPYKDPRWAPAEDRSVFLRPLSHPRSVPKEAVNVVKFFQQKGLKRIARRLFG